MFLFRSMRSTFFRPVLSSRFDVVSEEESSAFRFFVCEAFGSGFLIVLFAGALGRASVDEEEAGYSFYEGMAAGSHRHF